MNSRVASWWLIFGVIGLGSLRAGAPIVDTLPADGMPQVTKWEYPVYPPDALKEKVEGNLTVRAIVNTAGEVTEARVLEPMDPRLDAAAVAAVKTWKFSPGLEYGKPITFSMDVPIRFSVASAKKKAKAGLLPPSDLWPQPSPRTEVVERTTPGGDYPEILTERKIRGSVTVACTVNEEGRAIAPRVTGATHVDFIKPALDALALWEFAPATQGDLKVKAPVETKITFDAQSNQRSEILAGNGITAPDGSEPPEAPEPYIVADPVRPFELLMAEQGGSASAEFTVEPNGAVSGVKVREASAPEYGRALTAALETWGFYAARANGNAISVPLLLKVQFKAVPAGQESETDPVERLVAALRAGQVGSPKNLDERLTPIFRLPPAYPEALKEGESPAGEAKIEFVIDRTGRARLPRIVSASREEFGWAAATAVSQWVFRAPRRGGEPVDVLVQIPFEFSAPKK